VLTKTGDYRYFEGHISGNTFEAASFDGIYNYLLKGEVKKGVLKAELLSSYVTKIDGKLDPDANLPDAYAQTDAAERIAKAYSASETKLYDRLARLFAVLDKGDASLNDVWVVPEGGASAAARLLEGRVTAAWLEDPHWQPVAELSNVWLATTRPREAIGGVVLHERLVGEGAEREVGQALVRALVRTTNTYLGADYRSDEDVHGALVELTGWTPDQLDAVPPLILDCELRDGTPRRIQQALVPLGAVLYPEVQDDEVFSDTSLYLEAVGAVDGG
jgi:hypothetical protein